jgi:hypothetical protein
VLIIIKGIKTIVLICSQSFFDLDQFNLPQQTPCFKLSSIVARSHKMTIQKVLILALAGFISACASPTPFEEARLQTNTVYKFSKQTSNHSLYLKFLPPTGDSQSLLFKTVLNSGPIGSFRIGDPGVYHQKTFEVTARGKVRFVVIEEGAYEVLLLKHQYSHYGSQRESATIFRYQLDMRRAWVEQ